MSSFSDQAFDGGACFLHTCDPLLRGWFGDLRKFCSLAIAGLHAAGEVAGGVHGNSRPGAHSLLDCVVFGRVSVCQVHE